MTDVKQISDFKLERYLLGELPEVEMAALRKREAEDELFAARVKMMREEGERFLAENPFSALEDKLEMTKGRWSVPCGFAWLPWWLLRSVFSRWWC